MLNLRLLIKFGKKMSLVLRCRNKFGMTLRVAEYRDQGVILNLFQDLSAHHFNSPKVAMFPKAPLPELVEGSTSR